MEQNAEEIDPKARYYGRRLAEIPIAQARELLKRSKERDERKAGAALQPFGLKDERIAKRPNHSNLFGGEKRNTHARKTRKQQKSRRKNKRSRTLT